MGWDENLRAQDFVPRHLAGRRIQPKICTKMYGKTHQLWVCEHMDYIVRRYPTPGKSFSEELARKDDDRATTIAQCGGSGPRPFSPVRLLRVCVRRPNACRAFRECAGRNGCAKRTGAATFR